MVDQGDRRVTIVSSGTLLLQAHDTVTGAPTDINVIELGGGVTSGSVSVNVIGAHSLKQVNLYRTGVTSTITGLTLTGDLGENGVLVNSVTGTVSVGGDLRNAGGDCTANVTIGGRLLGNISGGNFNLTVTGAGTHTGSISAGSSGSPFAGSINFTNAGADLAGYIWLSGGLTGSISLAGNLLSGTFPSGMIHSSADVRGPIHVGGNVAGLIQVNGALRNATLEEEPAAASADITVGGNVTSTGSILVYQSVQRPVTVTGSCAGLIDLAKSGNTTYPVSGAVTVGNVATGGIVRVNTSLTGSLAINQNLSGSVDIAGSSSGGGNASGPITVGGDVGGSIHVAGQLTSGIFINGSLLNGPQDYDIDVASMGSAGAIAVDYDGWHAGHDWATGAVVRVAGTSYIGNDTGARVYEITGCKGDVNNDGAVNWRDIDPFVAAMDPATNFGTTYPGLAGSRVFHADTNCDGAVNWRDIDPFVALQNQPCTLGCAELQELLLSGNDSLAALDAATEDAGDATAAVPPNTAAGAGYTPAQTAALLYDNTTPDHRALLGYLIDQNAAAAPTTDLQGYWQAVAGFLPE